MSYYRREVLFLKSVLDLDTPGYQSRLLLEVNNMCSTRQKDEDGVRESKELWTADDVARFLSRSNKWIYRMAMEKRIPHITLSTGTIRFDPQDIQQWIESRKTVVE